MNRDRILIINGSPFPFVKPPLERFVEPLVSNLGIEVVTIERDAPPEVTAFAEIDRAYVISHSHGSEWFRIVCRRMRPWWPSGNKLGWSAIDSVRFSAEDDPLTVNPEYWPQVKNLPFVVPPIVTTCRAYHRKLPFDRAFAASLPLPMALMEFPFNSLFEAEQCDQDVTDTELEGSVSAALRSIGAVAEGPVGAIIGGVLGSAIDHSTICAAVAPAVLGNVRGFFEL